MMEYWCCLHLKKNIPFLTSNVDGLSSCMLNIVFLFFIIKISLQQLTSTKTFLKYATVIVMIVQEIFNKWYDAPYLYFINIVGLLVMLLKHPHAQSEYFSCIRIHDDIQPYFSGMLIYKTMIWKHFHVMCGFNLSTIRVSTVLQERFVEDLC